MPNIRFGIGIQRLIPYVGYHHVLMLVLTLAIVAAAVLAAGCHPSSAGLPGVYLLSLRREAEGGIIAVRAGYFGICVRTEQSDTWQCGSDSNALFGVLGASGGQDTSLLLELASHVSHDVVFPGLLLGGIGLMALCCFGLATFPGWHEEHDDATDEDFDIKPFPSRPVSQACLVAASGASLFLQISALWQHVASATAVSIITNVADRSIEGHVGAAAMALGWIAFALAVIVSIALLVVILSIQLLDRLTDD